MTSSGEAGESNEGRQPAGAARKPTRRSNNDTNFDTDKPTHAVRDSLASSEKKLRRGMDQATAAAPRTHVKTGTRQASAAVGRARSTPRQAAAAAAAGVDRGRAGVEETTGRAEVAGSITSAITGKARSVGAAVSKGALSTVSAAVGVGFSFLIGRALLLLELIKRLAHSALNALHNVLQRFQARLAPPAGTGTAG